MESEGGNIRGYTPGIDLARWGTGKEAFTFNSSLSKQFIELDLQNERCRSYCYKKENECIKAKIGPTR